MTAAGEGLVVIYALFPTAGEAHDVVRKLLEERLIASANRMAPGVSHFESMGELQAQEEHPVLIKTSATKADAAIKRLAALHSYDVPAILQWAVTDAHPDFAKWVRERTGARR